MQVIVRNSVKCLLCNDEIESTHRHDFVYCSCGNIAVDGGKDYLKRCGKDVIKLTGEKNYVDTSVMGSKEDVFTWTTYDGRKLKLKEIEDDHLNNIIHHLRYCNAKDSDTYKTLVKESIKRGLPETTGDKQIPFKNRKGNKCLMNYETGAVEKVDSK